MKFIIIIIYFKSFSTAHKNNGQRTNRNTQNMQYIYDKNRKTNSRLKTVNQFMYDLMTQAIKEPFVTSVKETLGDRYRTTLDVVYHKTIHFILTTLTTGFMYWTSSTTRPYSSFWPRWPLASSIMYWTSSTTTPYSSFWPRWPLASCTTTLMMLATCSITHRRWRVYWNQCFAVSEILGISLGRVLSYYNFKMCIDTSRKLLKLRTPMF